MDLYEEVKAKNVVAFFGNDLYRRFISLCVINRFSYQIRSSIDTGDHGHNVTKKSVILVSDLDQIPLEAKTIRNHTNLAVGEFISDDIPLKADSWNQLITDNHVLVMSCSLFATLLSRSLITLVNVNLIILNECHLVLSDDSYKQLSTFLQSADSTVTRLLAFAPSLMKCRRKPAEIEAIICKMEKLLQASRNTITDLQMSFRFPVKPKGKIIYYNEYQLPFDLINSDKIIQLLNNIKSLIKDCQHVFNSSVGINGISILQIMRKVFTVAKTMGTYCAMELTEIYAKELAELITNCRDSLLSAILSSTLSFFQYVQVTLRQQLSLLLIYEQLQGNVSEKMLSILKVLLDFVPELQSTESVKNPSGLHGIIFAEDRTTVRLLSAWLQGVSENFEQFKFIKVDYLVSNVKIPGSKLDFPTTSRLENMMYKYRKQDINLLVVSTSYEDSLELTKCNLVIRYDFPSTFDQYLNSKQKLRTDTGKYVLFIPRNSSMKGNYEQKLREFVSLENIMKSRELEVQRPPPYETLSGQFPPFVTAKDASVDLTNSILILHRYCTRLPSDTFTRLVPIYSYQTLDNGLIQCTIHLPTNSPVRDAITGSPANHQEVAQRSAALEACKALHQAGEINDLLWPVGKENNKCLEELGIKRPKRGPREALQDRPGTTKRRQSYRKSVAESLKGGDIVQGEPCYMYVFLMSLTCPIPEEQNTRGRKLVDPMDSPRFFGLITRSRISRICDFPVYTRSGEVLISMKWTAERLTFDADQINKLKQFHRFTFNDVLRLVKDPMVYEPADAPSSILIVPVNYSLTGSKDLPPSFKIDPNCISIDWQFIDKVLDYEKTDHTKERMTDFKFDKNVFEDAVVKPWYRSANEQLPFYVANICDYLKPTSQFPTASYPTFYDYYLKKYGIEITDKDQSLLDVDHTSARLNFLTPRFVNRKGMPLPKSTEKTRTAKRENLQSKQLLVPELCIVHPFSASYWNKAVCLPSILYRVNHLLIADQLRRQVAHDIGIGMTKDDPEFSWPALDFGWSLIEVLNQSNEDKDDDVDSTVSSVRTENAQTKKKKPSKPNPASTSSKVNTNNPTCPLPVPTKKRNEFESLPDLIPVTVPVAATEPADADDDCLLIDTFDPSIYKVENFDYDDDLGEIGSIGNWDQNGGGLFEIDIKNFGRIMDLDDEPKIVEVDDQGKPINQSNGCRVGSPSSFDSKGDKTGNWISKATGPNGVIDLEIPGLNLITTGVGVDLQTLSKDLENIHAYDDFEDSEDEDEGDMIGGDFEDYEDNFDEDQLMIPDQDESVTIMKEEKCKDILSSGLLLSSQNDELLANEDKTDGTSIYDRLKIPDSWVDSHIVSYSELDPEKVEKIFTFDEITLEDTDDLLIENDTTEQIIMGLDTDLDDLRSNHSLNRSNDISVIGSNDSDPQNLSIQSVFTDEMSFGEVIPSFGELLPNRDEINFPKDSVTKPIHLDPLNEEFDPEIGPSPAMVLQALTMSNASDGINLERLETVGDSFLKYAVTVFMYCQCHQHEGILSQLRSTQISNLKLYELGSEKNLGELMVATKFEPSDNWLPPGFKIPEKRYETFKSLSGDTEEKSFNCLLTQQSIPDKSIADCVEALIGAYLISCGPRGALLFMRWLGVMVMDNVKEPQPPTGLWRWLNPIKPPLFPNASSHDLMTLYRSYGLDKFEKQIIQYEFQDKAYLVQAFTHNSFSDNRVTDCYQRLEFLGDAVLDFLITRHLFDDPSQHSPGVLTDLRSALANNTFFASLAVEYEFHKYLMYKTSDLHKVISKFVEHHGSNGKLRDPVIFSLLLTEADCEQPEDIEVPKALGDVFESVAGAIFLDSGLSLDTVWRVYYNMMKPEMEYFSKNPPKSPIRELLEMKPQKVSFSKPENININGVVKTRISVEVFNVGKYFGIGRNRRLAKYTAAKRALRDLKAPNKNSSSD